MLYVNNKNCLGNYYRDDYLYLEKSDKLENIIPKINMIIYESELKALQLFFETVSNIIEKVKERLDFRNTTDISKLLISTIYRNFNVGDKILFTDLKEKLSNLYASINYNVNAKATDIFNYFEAKEYMTSIEVDGKKKRVRGYKLLSSYEQSFWDKLREMKKLD